MRLGSMLLCLAMTACTGAPAPRLRGTILHAGQVVQSQQLQHRLDEADLVCIGERHDRIAHHRAQLQVLRYMSRRSLGRGGELALGMEMVGRQHQAALDDYGSGRLDAAGLRRAVRWRKTWGYDFRMYQPMLQLCHAQGHRILGLNAPKALTRRVARVGLGGLPLAVRQSLPQLDLGVAAHRRFFWSVMGFDKGPGAHGHMASRAENFYTAQVLWDETMAEGAASWQGGKDGRQVMVIAGNGHCHRSAIVGRVQRRLPHAKTLSIAVLDEGEKPMPHTNSDFVIRVPAPPTEKSKARVARNAALLAAWGTDALVAGRR